MIPLGIGLVFKAGDDVIGIAHQDDVAWARKQHGAAFRSRARVQTRDFKWIQGKDLVTFYESSPGSYRGFCRVCGSPIINKFDERALAAKIDPEVPSRYGVGLATLDDDPGVRPACHSYVASKAPWFTITDDLPQFPEARSQACV